MSLWRNIILAAYLLSTFYAEAQTDMKAPLTLEYKGDSLLQLSFAWPQKRDYIDEGFFCYGPMPGMNLANGTPGQPALPTASTLVRLPKGSTLSVVEISGKEAEGEFSGGPILIAPITRGWAKDSERPPYEPDPKAYGTDAFLRNGDLLEVENLGVMGQDQMFRLTVRPTAYNPVRELVHDYITLNATLKVHKEPSTARSGKVLLVVSRPEFREGLQPFVLWKRQEGYRVEELYVETHKRDSIKAAMRPYFDNATALSPAPCYILLVGDAAQIQSFIGETLLEDEGHTTDLYYADYTGDYLPEALLGRWPVNDTAELRTVVEKTLRYEQFRDMDTLQLKRLLLVAGEEQSGQAPQTTNGQVNYVGREAKLAHPEIDTLCYHNPQSGTQADSIVADIGLGSSLLNYTAHCTVGGWTSPSMTIGRVEEAQGSQPTVYVNNCCKSNSFAGTGFGEQLLRLPVGGAVGVIGATNSTLWYEDYYWAVGPKWPVSLNATYDSTLRGAFDALAGSHPTIATMGELLAAGNLAVSAFGTSYDKFYWEIYCLLGDPTLKPWIGVPQPIDLRLTNGLINGQSAVYVGGTTGVTVTATQGGEVLGCTVIGPSGTAAISLSRTLDTLPLILTATGTGLWPRIDTLATETLIEHGATLREVNVGDTTVNCVVENIGNQRIDTLKVVLTQMEDDMLTGALIAEQMVIVDSLLPGARQTVVLPVNVETLGPNPYWQATLMAWDDGIGALCDLTLRHSLPVAYPTLQLKLLGEDGRETRRVLPGHIYRLEAVVEGSADSLLLKAEATPFGQWSATGNLLEFATPDSLCALAVDGTLHLGLWQGKQHLWLESGDRIESFEHGFDAHPWHNSNRVAWTLDSSESHSGHFSLRSGAIDHSQQTQICLDVEMLLRDTVSYWVKTSCEVNNDKMVFSVDGRDFIPQAWGIGDWRQRIHVLDPGHHTLCWRYSKNGSGSQGNDCVWIDDIQIPLAAWDTAYDWNCTGVAVGIEDTETDTKGLNLYPNPAYKTVWIDGPAGTEVRISDALGRTLTTLILNGDTPQRWDAANQPAGIYFATGIHNCHHYTEKIILLKP